MRASSRARERRGCWTSRSLPACMRNAASDWPGPSPNCSTMKPGARAWRTPRVCWPWTMRRSVWRDFWNNMGNRQQLIDFLGGAARRVHFVGIGGSGMSGLARLLLQQGHDVSGSDLSPNGGMKDLQKLGAKIHTGHAAKNLGEDTELVAYTSAVGSENVELQAADERKIPRVRRGLLLSAV